MGHDVLLHPDVVLRLLVQGVLGRQDLVEHGLDFHLLQPRRILDVMEVGQELDLGLVVALELEEELADLVPELRSGLGLVRLPELGENRFGVLGRLGLRTLLGMGGGRRDGCCKEHQDHPFEFVHRVAFVCVGLNDYTRASSCLRKHECVLDCCVMAKWREALLLVALAGVSLAPGAALPQVPPPALFEEGTRVLPGAQTEVMTSPGSEMANMEMIRESGGQIVEHGQVLYATMYGASFYVILVEHPDFPLLVRTVKTEDDVVGMQCKGGVLLVVLANHMIVRYDITNALGPVEGPATAVPEEIKLFGVRANVVEAAEGTVRLDAGEGEGVEEGMRFVIFGSRLPLGAPRAIIEITSVGEHSSTGKLPPLGSAAEGDRAYEAEKTWSAKHWYVPDPEPGYLHVSIDMKPIIGLRRGAGTFGFLSGLGIDYQFRLPVKLGLVLSPAGYGRSDVGSGAVFELGALVGLSSRLLGIRGGVGAHVSAGHGDHRLLLLTEIRLGSDESFNLVLVMNWVVPSAYRGGLVVLPSTAVAAINVPVTPRLALYVEFGGGNLALGEVDARGSGWANFVGGLRFLARGQSGSGAVVVSTGAGFGYVWAQTPLNRFDQQGGYASGLLLHVGIDWKK